jgi:glycosyltransferase involved in cell wall biosynthesis
MIPVDANNKKIKLVILIPTLECGGSEKYVSLLCNNISMQRFAVTLIVLNNAQPFYKISNQAVDVVDLKVKHVRHSLFKISGILKKIQPDIVFSAANHLNVYLAIFRRIVAPNSIFIARESSVVSSNSKRAKFPFLYNRLIKKYYRRFDCIICQSEFMQQDLIDHYNIPKGKTIVINNPVEAVAYPVSISAGHQAVVKIITVGRLSVEKGIDRLIRAMADVSIPFHFYIIGEGNQKATLKNLIDKFDLQNNVFLSGQKADPFKGMEDADLFLMGSHYEGFPNAVLEAGALGIPVVAFDAPGGIKNIITDGENGFLVKNSDEKLFTHTIEKALQTDFNRQQISNETVKRFSLKKMVSGIEDLFIQLTDSALA